LNFVELSSLIILVKKISELDRQIMTLEPKYRKSQTALTNTANISMSTFTLALQNAIDKTVSVNFIFLWLTISEKVQL